MKVLAVLGSHRADGVTAKALAAVTAEIAPPHTLETVVLGDLDISPDVPGRPNPTLDRLEQQMLDADVWVLAAPTYWGDMSGVMKHFLDCMRARLVRFDYDGQPHADRFRRKHYATITTCYTSALENSFMRVTDPTFQTFDKVLGAAGMIKVRELVVTSTWGLDELPTRKLRECARLGQRLSTVKRKDDETMKRYLQLFAMIAVMTLATMGLQRLLGAWLRNDTFWGSYVSFVLIFYVLLAAILRYASVMRHRRR